MSKTLNGQNFFKKNFKLALSLLHLPIFQCYLENPISIIACFPFYSPFRFTLIKLLRPHSICDCTAYKLIKYRQFQISENKLDETPYAIL